MPNGKPMIINTLAVYQALNINITVVIRAGDESLAAALDSSGVEVLENHNADQGLSQSIVAGVQQSAQSRAWLVGLADMPYVLTDTLASLVKRAKSDRITIPRSRRNGVLKTGNPICIGSVFKTHLLRLTGDVGAKNMINQYRESIEYVDCDDQGIYQDIDQLSDIIHV